MNHAIALLREYFGKVAAKFLLNGVPLSCRAIQGYKAKFIRVFVSVPSDPVNSFFLVQLLMFRVLRQFMLLYS